MEKSAGKMSLKEMAESGDFLEKQTFKLKALFLMGNGKKRTVVLNDLAPGLADQEVFDKMWELTELNLLVEDPQEQWVAPRELRRVEQRTHKIIDHVADGSLLYNQRMDYLDELCFDHCQYHRISPDHLNEQQRDAIAAKYWPFVLEKYPDKQPKRNRIHYFDGAPPQDGAKAMAKYKFEKDAGFPTMDELTKGNIWRACAKLKAYYHHGGDEARFLQGVRAIQLRTEWCNKIFRMKQDWIFRKELEAIYGKPSWCEEAKALFKPMILLMSDLIQVKLLEMLQERHRAEGLAQVVEDADEMKETAETMADKLAKLKEAATNGGLNACSVTA